MKRLGIGIGLCAGIALLLALSTSDAAGKNNNGAKDAWGYNYQANSFNGYYGNAGRPTPPVMSGDWLKMKWNDAWLDENKDRHVGYDSYIGSGAWLTNHQRWEDEDGKHTYFIKIIAVRSSDVKVGVTWYNEAGEEIGPVVWGQFAIVQEVESSEGLTYKSPVDPGLGNLGD